MPPTPTIKTFPCIGFLCLLTTILTQPATQQSTQPGAPFAQTNNFGYQADGSMDLTFAKSAQQKNEFIETAGKVQAGTNFLEHIFQTDGDDDFHFSLPVEQQIALYVYAYVVEDNTYVRIKDVEKEPPMRLAVYEGDQLIVKSTFFFQKYVVFNGNAHTKYLLKFQTSGNPKLLSLSLKLFVESADIHKVLHKGDAMTHADRTSQLKTSLSQLANKFGVYWIIDENNLRHSVQNIRRYYFFEVLEMVVVAVVSYCNVVMLFGLLKSGAIIV